MTRRKLWAIARYDLRLTEREWETMWAADFIALFQRRFEVQRNQDLRTAIAVCWLAQPHCENKLKPSDIFPWLG